jgi:hypothetical protein
LIVRKHPSTGHPQAYGHRFDAGTDLRRDQEEARILDPQFLDQDVILQAG